MCEVAVAGLFEGECGVRKSGVCVCVCVRVRPAGPGFEHGGERRADLCVRAKVDWLGYRTHRARIALLEKRGARGERGS